MLVEPVAGASFVGDLGNLPMVHAVNVGRKASSFHKAIFVHGTFLVSP